VRVGGGYQSLFISRRRLKEMADEDMAPSDRERADGVAVVVDNTMQIVVTVLRLSGSRSRRYLRRIRSWKPSINPVHLN
jgi:hypothetical protein